MIPAKLGWRGWVTMFRNEKGYFSEGRLFAIAGKAIICYMLLAFSKEILADSISLLLLISALIAPKLFEKVLYLRLGGKNGTPAEASGKV